jgi:hypothetical protein
MGMDFLQEMGEAVRRQETGLGMGGQRKRCG